MSKDGHHFSARLAEWISFGVSLLLILALAVFLVYEALTRDDNPLPIAIDVQTDKAAPTGDRFVLPIRVRNLGMATMRSVQIRVSFDRADPSPPIDLQLDYLGEKSEQMVYVYTDRDPRLLHPIVTPLAYQED
jgi:uncharacterized protein (TIGR02588 family)